MNEARFIIKNCAIIFQFVLEYIITVRKSFDVGMRDIKNYLSSLNVESHDCISSIGRGPKCPEENSKEEKSKEEEPIPLPIKKKLKEKSIGADMVMPPAPIKGF